jgi:predicted Rossmann-fold nucleotide-binding protein
MHMREIKNVCVYCGSSIGADPRHTAAARAVGVARARARVGLVYGGGAIGLMGVLAKATVAAGGVVTGIIPEFLDRREVSLRARRSSSSSTTCTRASA